MTMFLSLSEMFTAQQQQKTSFWSHATITMAVQTRSVKRRHSFSHAIGMKFLFFSILIQCDQDSRVLKFIFIYIHVKR